MAFATASARHHQSGSGHSVTIPPPLPSWIVSFGRTIGSIPTGLFLFFDSITIVPVTAMGTSKTAASSRKRKQVDDEPTVPDTEQVASSFKKSKKDELALATDEKRLRRFRDKAPQAFAVIYERATTQRFFVLSRKRIPVWDSFQGFEEEVEIAGSTGNIYTVTIARQPTCTCPMGEKNEQCKHIIYVLARVLRAKYEYVYQLALLSCELEEIFDNAPPIVEDGDSAAATGEGDKKRKPIEGDCPICFNEMEAHKPEEIVWCRAACGQNIHKECFEMWAATKRKQAGGSKAEVTCPYCRSVWEGDDDMIKMIKKGKPTSEGYVNVADQLGISQVRDTSTYHYGGSRSGYTFGRNRSRRYRYY